MLDVTFDQIDFTKYLVLWFTSFTAGFLLIFIPLYIPLYKAKIENSGKKLLLVGVFILFAIFGGLITLFFADISFAEYFFTR